MAYLSFQISVEFKTFFRTSILDIYVIFCPFSHFKGEIITQ